MTYIDALEQKKRRLKQDREMIRIEMRASGSSCPNIQEMTYPDGLVQDCSISIANALEILQSCTKPSI